MSGFEIHSNWGLALSGGGARGAYQYGAWRALQGTSLLTSLKVVSGTSIGAINAALFVQQQVTGKPVARIFWEEFDLSDIFSAMPAGKKELDATDYLRLGWDGLQHFGIRIDPLKSWLREHLDVSVSGEAGIVLWANSWNLFKLREEAKRFPGTEKHEFVEWVIGSASFPFFGPHRYEGRYLLDGGIANNLPLDLAFQEKSVDQLLAIDLASFMRFHPRQLRQQRQYRDHTHFLRVGLDLPSPAAFSRSSIDLLIERGYKDTRNWWSAYRDEHCRRSA